MTDYFAKAEAKLREAHGATQPALRANLLQEAQVYATLAGVLQPAVHEANAPDTGAIRQELAAANVLGAWSFTNDETGWSYTLAITGDGRAIVMDEALLAEYPEGVELYPAAEESDEEASIRRQEAEDDEEADDFLPPEEPTSDELAARVAAGARQPKGKK